MSIIDNTYFKQQLKLPVDNIDDDGIQSWINKEEPVILRKILGYSLYKDFIAGLVPETPDAKWTNLRDGVEYTDSSGNLQKYDGIYLIIADHVFDAIVSDLQTEATDSGVKNPLTDNADAISPRYKQRFAQNDMVNRIAVMDNFITVTNNNTPDTYENYLPETIEKTNIFNI